VAGVVQLNTEQRLHRLRMAQQIVDMALGDAIEGGAVLVGALHVEEISQAHLGEYHRICTDHLHQHVVQGEFGSGEEVVTDLIWVRDLAFSILREKQPEQRTEASSVLVCVGHEISPSFT
jgi:hypothetical protein